jgi:hypothetical protein
MRLREAARRFRNGPAKLLWAVAPSGCSPDEEPHRHRTNATIRKLFGASPSVLASRAPNALGRAFRFAAGGGLVYV